jgi:hypothetical protein
MALSEREILAIKIVYSSVSVVSFLASSFTLLCFFLLRSVTLSRFSRMETRLIIALQTVDLIHSVAHILVWWCDDPTICYIQGLGVEVSVLSIFFLSDIIAIHTLLITKPMIKRSFINMMERWYYVGWIFFTALVSSFPILAGKIGKAGMPVCPSVMGTCHLSHLSSLISLYHCSSSWVCRGCWMFLGSMQVYGVGYARILSTQCLHDRGIASIVLIV